MKLKVHGLLLYSVQSWNPTDPYSWILDPSNISKIWRTPSSEGPGSMNLKGRNLVPKYLPPYKPEFSKSKRADP